MREERDRPGDNHGREEWSPSNSEKLPDITIAKDQHSIHSDGGQKEEEDGRGNKRACETLMSAASSTSE